MPSTSIPNLHVGGVPVHFPHTPYRAQVALMHAVVKAINNHDHALVESPTGTGKSLALLCSSLATQQHLTLRSTQKTFPTEIKSEKREGAETSISGHSTSPKSSPRHITPQPDILYSNPVDSDEDDFQPKRTYRDISWQRPASKDRKRPVEELPENSFMLHRRDDPLDPVNDPSLSSSVGAPGNIPSSPPCKPVPRIFYATRTHNQVTQVIGELRKTSYRPALSVLASRREYCINKAVREMTARDDSCKRLVADSRCSFYFEFSNLALHPQLAGEAWDIEELSNLGERIGGCPYYASHELYQSARLILCPYSFLVDPIVRDARGINLSGDVVILDEAHNIENYAREAASFETDVALIRRNIDEIDTLMLTTRHVDGGAKLIVAYRRLKALFVALIALVESVTCSEEFKQHETNESAVYERQDMLRVLADVDINCAEVGYWRASYDFIVHYGDGNEDKRFQKLGFDRPVIELSPQKQRHVSSEPGENGRQGEKEDGTNDPNVGHRYGGSFEKGLYEANIDEFDGQGPSKRKIKRGRFSKKLHLRNQRSAPSDDRGEGPWIAKCMSMSHSVLTTLTFLFDNVDDFVLVVDRKTVDFVTIVTLSIHCLNAAVCFRDVSNKARSVIVASGTLSPMSSFAGELGTQFAISKSLPHVIDVQRQLYIGIVGNGPRHIRFEGTYHGSARFDFQDALADALVDYCKVIPGGVLVFFPSYRMMDRIHSRWKTCGSWDRLEDVKSEVLVEPTQRGEGFDAIVAKYQAASTGDGGALLFAVCRGKLSEGIDFRDETSRAVVLVGIPFPYKNDVVVTQKRKWNDRSRLEGNRKELQNGAQWYEMQAYRALNQALGRAVRHRFDYGAILLVDIRFRQERVLSQLPQWTRSAVRRTNTSHETIVSDLDVFYRNVHQHLARIADQERQQRRCHQPSQSET